SMVAVKSEAVLPGKPVSVKVPTTPLKEGRSEGVRVTWVLGPAARTSASATVAGAGGAAGAGPGAAAGGVARAARVAVVAVAGVGVGGPAVVVPSPQMKEAVKSEATLPGKPLSVKVATAPLKAVPSVAVRVAEPTKVSASMTVAVPVAVAVAVPGASSLRITV